VVSFRLLAMAAAFGAGLVTVYAVVQEVGLDPIEWVIQYAGRFATLGNPNFMAGYLAIILPLVGYLAFTAPSLWARVAWMGLTVWLSIGIAVSRSVQGPVAAAGGVSVLGLALARHHGLGSWSLIKRSWAVIATSAGVVAIAGAIGVGPLSTYLLDTLQDRRWYWQTAAGMFRSSPLVGVGPGHYGMYYREFRPFDAWDVLGSNMSVSSAHSVPFEMFAVGGLLLGLAYLAVVAVVARALMVGLQRLEGDALLALGGFGGAWLAYQLQSLVSIDVPQLGLFHWVTGAAVVTLSGATAVTDFQVLGRRDSLLKAAAYFAAAVVVVLGITLAPRPYRADLASRSNLIEAVQLAPWESFYWLDLGAAAEEAGLTENAQRAYQRSVEADPRYWNGLLDLTRLTVRSGEIDTALPLAERILEVDAIEPFVRADTAGLYLRVGAPGRAIELLDYALAVEPERADWWLLLAEAHDLDRNPAEADVARARAIALDPALGEEPG